MFDLPRRSWLKCVASNANEDGIACTNPNCLITRSGKWTSTTSQQKIGTLARHMSLPTRQYSGRLSIMSEEYGSQINYKKVFTITIYTKVKRKLVQNLTWSSVMESSASLKTLNTCLVVSVQLKCAYHLAACGPLGKPTGKIFLVSLFATIWGVRTVTLSHAQI